MQVKAIRIQGSENLCGSQAWVKAKAIDYLQDRQKNPILKILSMHRSD